VWRLAFCYGLRMRGIRASFASLLLLCLAACVASCGGASRASTATIGTDDDARTGAPEGWPRVLVVMPGSGPALYLGSEDESPAIGYVTGGTRVRIDGPPRNGRVPVTVAGGLAARGWVPLGRVGAYVTQRGRIEETPTYVGIGDLVGILEQTDGGFRVQVGPWLGRAENDRLGPWTATLPASWLGADRASEPDTSLTPGENRRLPAGQEVAVYDRPNGRVLSTLPAADPPHTVVVLRERAGWAGIRAGVGPYLVGYIRSEQLTAAEGPPRATYQPARAGADGMPARIGAEDGTLHRVSQGARVRFLDRTIARLRSTGWAREIGRVGDGRLDLYVAVDDSMAIRGLVRERDLEGSAAGGAAAGRGRGSDELGDDEP
jgi:hypothetical protein